MKKNYSTPHTTAVRVSSGQLMLAESPGMNGTTPWGDLGWGGTEGGQNPMYVRTWRNKLWDDVDEIEQ